MKKFHIYQHFVIYAPNLFNLKLNPFFPSCAGPVQFLAVHALHGRFRDVRRRRFPQRQRPADTAQPANLPHGHPEGREQNDHLYTVLMMPHTVLVMLLVKKNNTVQFQYPGYCTGTRE
jgi:hypothetical protein